MSDCNPKLQQSEILFGKKESDREASIASDNTELERRSETQIVGAGGEESANHQRFLVRIKSRRKRLLDEDNLCEKFAVDCCRYAGLLPDDAPGETKIEISQEKVGKEEREETLIEIFDLT